MTENEAKIIAVSSTRRRVERQLASIIDEEGNIVIVCGVDKRVAFLPNLPENISKGARLTITAQFSINRMMETIMECGCTIA